MIAPHSRVGIAVSGGADSVCLLHILHRLAPSLDASLHVLHLNHRLRGAESDADAAFVHSLAGALGLPCTMESLDVRSLDPNLEQAGRIARRRFFALALSSGSVDCIATGHTRSDQAETVLYRLLRGSGTAGLAGILPTTAERLIRPLLWCDRAEIEAWLQEQGIEWRTDSSNADLAFDRNRLRHQLLPLLARDYNPSIASTLAGMSVLAQDEEEYWAAEIDRISTDLFDVSCGTVVLDVRDLHPRPRAVTRRILRRAIQMVKGDLRGIGIAHVEGVLALTLSPAGSGRLQIPGLDVFRSFEWLRIAPPRSGPRSDRDYQMALELPVSIAVPGSPTTLHLALEDRPEGALPFGGYNKEGSLLDAGRVSGPLMLRNWHPGDRYTRPGCPEERLKTLFQESRIPIWERQGWPVITLGNDIIWARRFGASADCAATPESRRILRISETRESYSNASASLH